MAFTYNQQRSSRRGHGVGHRAPSQQYHMTYMPDPLEGADAPGLFMTPHGFNAGSTIDPRYLTLDQAAPGGNGVTQDPGSLDHFQPGFDAGVHPQSSGTDPSYLDSTRPNLSGDDLDMSA